MHRTSSQIRTLYRVAQPRLRREGWSSNDLKELGAAIRDAESRGDEGVLQGFGRMLDGYAAKAIDDQDEAARKSANDPELLARCRAEANTTPSEWRAIRKAST